MTTTGNKPGSTAGLAATRDERAAEEIVRVDPVIGMEVHVELRTRRKVFAPSPSPAHPEFEAAPPNTLLDPVVLALPGALPVLNREAVELSVLVGLALRCGIAETCKWDRKGYTYPDLPKGYQISQYDLPVCFDGVLEVPGLDDKGEADFAAEPFEVGIIRAHLEEDAGKLLHEAPGGGRLEGPAGGASIVDLNRAGTALLEIVTQPDITSADRAVAFCRELWRLCRFLGATEGVLQKGHVRFEPNVNCHLHTADGRLIKTPIAEVKNLNSFRAVKGAIEHELREQPKRWVEDGREFGPGTKTTRGWDDARQVTVVQREKEDAHDYRYFPDPDLPPVRIDEAWRGVIGQRLVESPASRARRYCREWGLSPSEAATLIDERAESDFFEAAIDEAVELGLARHAAARAVANVLLQQGAALAKERGVAVSGLGLSAAQAAQIAKLRDEDAVQSQAVGKLIEKLGSDGYAGKDARHVAEYEGWIVVRDEGALDAWCDEVLAANPKIVEQIRGGKAQAVGRLIGEVMKKSGGSADAKAVREKLLERCGAG